MDLTEKEDLLNLVLEIDPNIARSVWDRHITQKAKRLSDYDVDAIKFLIETKTSFSCVSAGRMLPSWSDNKKDKPVDAYNIILKNKNNDYQFLFYSSIHDTYGPSYRKQMSIYNAQKANEKHVSEKRYKTFFYDVLACLSIDYCEDFEDFCLDYGYDEDSIKANEVYKAVRKETKNIKRLWPTEQEQEKLHNIA